MRKPAEIRKTEIVATVLDLADRLGPDRVTTGAVAAAIGITQAALFRHYPAKAVLWAAVAAQAADRMNAAWEAALAGEDTPRARLRGLIGAQLGQIAATPALPMLLYSRELNVGNPDLRSALHGRLMAFRTLLAGEVAAGQRAGDFRDDIAAADAAVLLAALVQGVAIRWSLGARDFALRDEGIRLLEVQLQLLAAKGNAG